MQKPNNWYDSVCFYHCHCYSHRNTLLQLCNDMHIFCNFCRSFLCSISRFEVTGDRSLFTLKYAPNLLLLEEWKGVKQDLGVYFVMTSKSKFYGLSFLNVGMHYMWERWEKPLYILWYKSLCIIYNIFLCILTYQRSIHCFHWQNK